MLAQVELMHDKRSVGRCSVDEKIRVVYFGGAYLADTGRSHNFVREFQMSPECQVVEKLDAS